MRERSPSLNTLDILAIGKLSKFENRILEAHSTSTLIRAGDVNIIVDTSSKFYLPMIRTSLKQLGVLPKDVSIIVNTHMHHDHCENNDLFRKAEFYVREEECPGDKNYISVSKDAEIADGVKLVHTPGHTRGSVSVFIESEKRYVIAGDAVPLEDNVRRMIPPGLNYDPVRAVESIKSITEYADIIVPGHGSPFTNDKRKRK